MSRPVSDFILELKKFQDRVYYQKPDGSQLIFPCFVVERNYVDVESADNHAYRRNKSYIVNYFTRSDTDGAEDFMFDTFPYTRLTGYNMTDGLYQETYRVYF